MNKIRTSVFKVDPLDEEDPVNKDDLPNGNSKAGQGMAKGSGNGTADDAAAKDNSADNADNAG